MPARASRRLVVDACVARSCGRPDATFPTSKRCRDFLMAMLATGHSVAMTPAIVDEWKRHQSAFARGWRLQMVARKRWHLLDVPSDGGLRDRVAMASLEESHAGPMLHDCHLIEAALAADRRVASLDETVRGLFHSVAPQVRQLEQIVWVNPDAEEEEPILWLQNGARPDRRRCLGFVPDE